jgi:hypothetical protein
MKNEYQEWIESNYPTQESASNRCNEAVRKMREKFPELDVRVGMAGGRYHCWLVTDGGEIVDPTKKQFSSAALGYTVVAHRFLERDEIEPSTGAIFLKSPAF